MFSCGPVHPGGPLELLRLQLMCARSKAAPAGVFVFIVRLNIWLMMCR